MDAALAMFASAVPLTQARVFLTAWLLEPQGTRTAVIRLESTVPSDPAQRAFVLDATRADLCTLAGQLARERRFITADHLSVMLHRARSDGSTREIEPLAWLELPQGALVTLRTTSLSPDEVFALAAQLGSAQDPGSPAPQAPPLQ
jgi:hypothetical protein